MSGAAKGCGIGCLGLIGIFMLFGVIGTLFPTKSPPPPPKVATIDHSTEKQSERRKLIDNLIDLGVFSKVEKPRSLPYVWVRPQFYALDFDDKQRFMGVVFAYYFDGSEQTPLVRIFDARTNKEIGTFSQSGLRLD